MSTAFVSEIPEEAGRLVAMTTFRSEVIIACEHGVFRIENGFLVQIKIKFVEKELSAMEPLT